MDLCMPATKRDRVRSKIVSRHVVAFRHGECPACVRRDTALRSRSASAGWASWPPGSHCTRFWPALPPPHHSFSSAKMKSGSPTTRCHEVPSSRLLCRRAPFQVHPTINTVRSSASDPRRAEVRGPGVRPLWQRGCVVSRPHAHCSGRPSGGRELARDLESPETLRELPAVLSDPELLRAWVHLRRH